MHAQYLISMLSLNMLGNELKRIKNPKSSRGSSKYHANEIQLHCERFLHTTLRANLSAGSPTRPGECLQLMPMFETLSCRMHHPHLPSTRPNPPGVHVAAIFAVPRPLRIWSRIAEGRPRVPGSGRGLGCHRAPRARHRKTRVEYTSRHGVFSCHMRASNAGLRDSTYAPRIQWRFAAPRTHWRFAYWAGGIHGF